MSLTDHRFVRTFAVTAAAILLLALAGNLALRGASTAVEAAAVPPISPPASSHGDIETAVFALG